MDVLDGMRAFRAVVDAGSFVGAARALGITTAWVSKRVAQIEEHLGPLNGGRPQPDWEFTRTGLLASTHAAQACRRVVDLIHNTAGTTASRMNHPLERKLRDSHQAAAHGGVSWRHYGNMGKTYIGHEPPGGYATPTRA